MPTCVPANIARGLQTFFGKLLHSGYFLLTLLPYAKWFAIFTDMHITDNLIVDQETSIFTGKIGFA